MRKAVALVGCVAIASLAGCGPRMSYADQCSSYGFAYGSSQHGQCQMMLARDEDQRMRNAGDSMIYLGGQLMNQPAYQPPVSGVTTYSFPRGSMTCTRLGNMVNCN